MSNFKKLKVGILVDDEKQSFLVKELYKKSLNSKYYSIDFLIIQKKNNKQISIIKILISLIKTKGFLGLVDWLIFSLIDKMETFLMKRKTVFKNIYFKYPISNFDVQKLYIEPEISSFDLSYTYKDSDLKTLKKLNLDLLVKSGSEVLKGKILKISRLGVISFNYNDNNFYKVNLAGFWEVVNQYPTTEFFIKFLTDDKNNDEIIFRGNIATSFMYKINLCKLYLKSNIFLHQTIEKLSYHNNDIKSFPKISYAHSINKFPRFYETTLYLIKTFFLGSKKKINKIFGYYYRWCVGYQFTKDWKSPLLKNSIEIKNPKNRFLADPFVTNYNNKTVLYVEDFNYRLNKGVISAYEINEEEYREIGIAIEEKFHLSYPFLIQDQNELFMIPETGEAKDIRIYKNVEFPMKWKLHKILMSDVSATDTNIIYFNNKYWMFTNIDSSKTGDHTSELHIFYSDNLITTDWKPHKKNPVIFDANQARNGGMIFSKNDELLRVFQKQGFDMYGKSLGISRIKILNETDYSEEIIKIIEPNFLKDIKGTHSYTYNSNVLAIDFVRLEKIND